MYASASTCKPAASSPRNRPSATPATSPIRICVESARRGRASARATTIPVAAFVTFRTSLFRRIGHRHHEDGAVLHAERDEDEPAVAKTNRDRAAADDAERGAERHVAQPVRVGGNS